MLGIDAVSVRGGAASGVRAAGASSGADRGPGQPAEQPAAKPAEAAKPTEAAKPAGAGRASGDGSPGRCREACRGQPSRGGQRPAEPASSPTRPPSPKPRRRKTGGTLRWGQVGDIVTTDAVLWSPAANETCGAVCDALVTYDDR